MRYVLQLLHQSRQYRIRLTGLSDFLKLFPRNVFSFLNNIKGIGVTAEMSSVEKSKLGIFNHLNFFSSSPVFLSL